MGPADRAAVAAALDRRLDPHSRAPLAVALSGGSDSLALLLCARDWAGRTGRPLLALSVDHRLHPNSGRWTEAAGAAAGRAGAAWRALSWDDPKPAAGLPAAARRARHALLARAVRQAGGCVLLMGHTADDVAESELIRQETPTHGRLAEWAPSPVWPEGRGVLLLRPLLDVRRVALRAALQAEGIGWLEDPGNDDLRYARSRARKILAISREADEVGAARNASHARKAGAIGDHASAAVLTLDRIPPPALDLLAKALLCVGGGERPPSGHALVRLEQLTGAGERFVKTLAGVRLEASDAALQLTRELGRRAPPPIALAPGETMVFDGRFEVCAEAAGWRVAPLAGYVAALPPADREALRAIPAAGRPSLPVLVSADGSARLPAPFGGGPATAHSLIADRLDAALGRISDERALSARSSARPHGVAPPVILSSSPGT